MLKLEEQNQFLKKQLVESQMQIKNLTYNVKYFRTIIDINTCE